MTPKDIARADILTSAIIEYQEKKGQLPGLQSDDRTTALVAQFIDSLRRIEFAHYIRNSRQDPRRIDPASDMFDPLRAAVLCDQRGQKSEAWWLVFLATHFGKHTQDGWRLTRDIYGKLGQGGLWDWAAISTNQAAFETWYTRNQQALSGGDGVTRRFSNHRKFETLKASSPNGPTAVVASYVAWVAPPRTNADIIKKIHRSVGQNPHEVFKSLYKSMNAVKRFGRLGKFDFLTMLGKLGIAPIEPGSSFLKGASGPLAGARLLFEGATEASLSANELETKLAGFGEATGLGGQALEDALCNWQKSPDRYLRFRG